MTYGNRSSKKHDAFVVITNSTLFIILSEMNFIGACEIEH
jgi:hypothetical protein